MMMGRDRGARIERGMYGVLFVSALLRVWLGLSGGHSYWPDEGVYRGVTEAIAHGDVRAALAALDDRGHHFVFRLVWVIPDAIEYVTGFERVAPLFFGLVSVASIWLLWQIARRGGASPTEAAAAAALLAASTSFFYWSRHLLPYDVAIALGLLSLYVGLPPRPAGPDSNDIRRRPPTHTRAWRSLASGCLAALTFLTYPGYWTFAAALSMLAVVLGSASWGEVARRALLTAAGGLATLASAQAAFTIVTGRSLLDYFTRYADTITQGVFEEGWRVPFEYLWHTEHLLLVLWMLALGSCLLHVLRGRVSPLARGSLAAALLTYVVFVIASVELHRFVIYGRLVRQLVPFLCIVAAHELERYRTAYVPRGRRWMAAVAVGVCLQAAVNFWQPLRQTFPRDFQNRYGPLITGLPPDQYRWINVGHIYPAPEVVVLPPRYTVLGASPHPLEFEPYLYEGYTPAERDALRAGNLTMRLVVFGAE